MSRTTQPHYRSAILSRSRQLALIAAGSLVSIMAQAEMPVTPLSTSSALASGIELVRERMDEIIVYAPRVEEASTDILLSDPLRARILNEIQELKLLDEEFEWRMETANLSLTPPRMRLGYDPRNEERSTQLLTAQALPLDITQAATVISVDF